MSLDRVLKILEGFSVSKADAEVYVYLAKMGPTRSTDLAAGLGKTKSQVYPILRRLKKKGVVTYDKGHPALLSALAFEELLEQYVQLKMEQAKNIKDTKKQLLRKFLKRTNRNNM